jgi:hypothetical protein
LKRQSLSFMVFMRDCLRLPPLVQKCLGFGYMAVTDKLLPMLPDFNRLDRSRCADLGVHDGPTSQSRHFAQRHDHLAEQRIKICFDLQLDRSELKHQRRAVGGCAGTTLANTGALGADAAGEDRFSQTYAADGAMPIFFARSTTRAPVARTSSTDFSRCSAVYMCACPFRSSRQPT